jgi:L-asparagine transporter-like permease
MEKFDIYIGFIIFIKVGFVILAITHLYLKFKHEEHSETDKKIVFWKERLEFIFIILMAVLLIYLFKPDSDRSMLITHETKILLYLFGFILLITAKWDDFLKESPFFKMIQKIV